MLFTVIKGPSLENAYQTILHLEKDTQGFELRLDTFESIHLIEIKKLMHLTQKPIIFTLRFKSQGGEFEGSETERNKIFCNLLDLKPALLDLEYDSDKNIARDLKSKFPKTKIICSLHDFERTPSLDQLFDQMREFPADFYKIATKTTSSLDALRMLQFVKQKTLDGIAISGICMGHEGGITRILGRIFGNTFDFVASTSYERSAPGQLTLETLRDTYHYYDLNRSTAIYALLGDPIQQSPSHITHNQVFRQLGINAVYVKIPLKKEELPTFFELIKDLPFKGFSITIPLKEAAMNYAQAISQKVHLIGAVNTFTVDKRQIHGENTDCIGALDAIEEKIDVRDKKCVILGAGGSARAIAYEAINRGAKVIILNRTENRAIKLANALGCRGFSMEFCEEICLEGYDILINCTSVGMIPKIDQIPLSPKFILPRTIVMDVITSPKETLFLQEAKKKNCTLIYGYQMFMLQALKQFELWLGKKIPQKTLEDIYFKMNLSLEKKGSLINAFAER